MSSAAAVSTRPVVGERRPRSKVKTKPPGVELLLIYAMWTMLFFEFHNYLPTLIGLGPIIRRIPILLMLLLAVVAVARLSKRSLYWPYAVFVLMHLIMLPFVMNRGLAMIGFKTLLLFFIPFTATLALARKPHEALNICKLLLLSFPWYCIQGLPRGAIGWHNLLGNPDAFGPLGVMATALGYYFALGAAEKKWQRAGMLIAALGVVALVASFARGAFVSGAVLCVLVFYRSKRKAVLLRQGAVLAILLVIAAEIFFPGGAFWAEMATIADGANTGTGATRWELWTGAGLRVFLHSPIFGVGAFNTGPVAGEIVPYGAMAGKFTDPAVLYNKQMHNVYVQLFAEQGLVGATLWGVMLVTYFKRLAALRTKKVRLAWRQAGGHQFDIYFISLGLEAAMIVFLTGGIFYNQVYRHWFYTLILISLLLRQAARPRAGSGESPSPRPSPNPRPQTIAAEPPAERLRIQDLR